MPTYVVTGPDGARYRVSAPEGATEAQVRAAVQQQGRKSKPTSFWQGVVEEGGRALSNLQWVGDALTGKNITRAITGQPTPADITRAQLAKQKANAKYRGSTAGKITGGILGALPSLAVPGGALAQGAAGGFLLTQDPNDLATTARDVTIGAVTGKAGDVVGRRVLAPVAERIGRTAPVRKLGEAAARAVGRAPLPLPKITKAERIVSRSTPEIDAIRQTADDAARLNLPLSLADTDPRLRALGGSVARFSPDARALAEQNFVPRSMGQADRAVDAIDNLLAPVTNIEQRAGDIRTAAQAASAPFYDQARSMAAPVDEEVAAMLRTPAGKEALRSAFTIAQNKGRNPLGIGFDLNDQGEVILKDAPSFETLQLVKRGLDEKLSSFRNPITGNLELDGNPGAQAIAGLTQRFNERLKTINEPYRQGNEAYAREIARREALRLGQDVAANNVPQRQFDAALARQTETTLPELQRGYATAMADAVNRQRLSANPYNTVYGSPLQQGKVGAMFPQGADDFGRVYQLENEMAKTMTETLGGSQTQPRRVADEMFQGGIASDAADAGIQALTGGGIPGGSRILGAAARALKDRSQLGLLGAKTKADQLAPTLFDTNPAAITSFLDGLARKQAEEELRKRAYQQTFGLLGVPAAGIGVVNSR